MSARPERKRRLCLEPDRLRFALGVEVVVVVVVVVDAVSIKAGGRDSRCSRVETGENAGGEELDLAPPPVLVRIGMPAAVDAEDEYELGEADSSNTRGPPLPGPAALDEDEEDEEEEEEAGADVMPTVCPCRSMRAISASIRRNSGDRESGGSGSYPGNVPSSIPRGLVRRWLR